ncbi:MAG TPA: hypothetical protein VF746_13440 [Longimicrobium sp.]
MIHLVKLSGGAASAVTADLVRMETGAAPECLFTDTLIEDNDLYRFLLEWCGYLYGVDVSDLVPLALTLPQVWEDEPGRKAALAHLRMRASARLPQLHWLADGRHPFEVFFEEGRMGGGARQAGPCSRILKRALSDDYVAARWSPEAVRLYVGLAHSEGHRFHGGRGRGGIRRLFLPWLVYSPLVDRPDLDRPALRTWIRGVGIATPRLYAQGFPTNNCGGACVKAGHAWWIHLLNTNRPYFLWWAALEDAFRRATGKDVSILRDRRGGRTRPLTLYRLLQLVEAQTDLTELLIASDTGCGGSCMLPATWGRRRKAA